MKLIQADNSDVQIKVVIIHFQDVDFPALGPSFCWAPPSIVHRVCNLPISNPTSLVLWAREHSEPKPLIRDEARNRSAFVLKISMKGIQSGRFSSMYRNEANPIV